MAKTTTTTALAPPSARYGTAPHRLYINEECAKTLLELATLVQDIRANQERSRGAHRSPKLRDATDWYATKEGYDVLESLRMRAVPNLAEEFKRRFEERVKLEEIPGANTESLRNKFPITHCAGTILKLLLDRYAKDLKAELLEEREKSHPNNAAPVPRLFWD